MCVVGSAVTTSISNERDLSGAAPTFQTFVQKRVVPSGPDFGRGRMRVCETSSQASLFAWQCGATTSSLLSGCRLVSPRRLRMSGRVRVADGSPNGRVQLSGGELSRDRIVVRINYLLKYCKHCVKIERDDSLGSVRICFTVKRLQREPKSTLKERAGLFARTIGTSNYLEWVFFSEELFRTTLHHERL